MKEGLIWRALKARERHSYSVQEMMLLVTQSCPTLYDPVDHSLPGSSAHEDSPGKNTGVGCHFLLQGIFLTQGLNLGLQHCRQIFYPLSQQGSPAQEGRTGYKVWEIRPELCEQECGILEMRSGTSGWDCEDKDEEDCSSGQLNQFTYTAT